jgi:hypothetical protein
MVRQQTEDSAVRSQTILQRLSTWRWNSPPPLDQQQL